MTVVNVSSAYLVSTMFAIFLLVSFAPSADAQEVSADSRDNVENQLSESPEDPDVLLSNIEQQRTQENSVFAVAPLHPVYNAVDRWTDDLDNKAHLKLGAAFTHLFMGISESPLGNDEWGTASDLDLLGTWELTNIGKPNKGQLYIHFEGRWDYGTTGPEVLGTESLGSLVGTANTFSGYDPTFIMRNFYWQQGSETQGWAFRVGKITTDAILSTSAHIASPITFLPTAGTGAFANALTDSGLGIAATWYVNDGFKMLGIISDANADRSNFGDIGAGDFYKAIEFAARIAPRTEKAGYSKLTFWHTDATKNGQVVNGHLGPEGWGFFIKHEQELSADGRAIVAFRYGKSYNESAAYEEQFGAHFLLYDPVGAGRLGNDLFGVAVNWVQANVEGARPESNLEVFYRFPIFPNVDMTLSYQSLFNLALDPNNDHASAYALRLRTAF
jgi:porin